MNKEKFKVLDDILHDVLIRIKNSKSQITEISQSVYKELSVAMEDRIKLDKEYAECFKLIKAKEREEKAAREHLAKVSSNLHSFSEKELQAAYVSASNLQLEIDFLKEREKDLTAKIRLNAQLQESYISTINRSKQLTQQLETVNDYLGNKMLDLISDIQDLRYRQVYSEYIIYGQEEERMRLARDIHDGPAQSMAGISFKAEYCKKIIDKDVPKCKSELGVLAGLVRGTLDEVRKIIFNLRPMAIDDLGFYPAIANFLEKISFEHNLTYNLKTTGKVIRLQKHVEVALYRVVQEAVNNIIKHSNAEKFDVTINFEEDEISFKIQDYGQGFDLNKSKREDSFGIMGINERLNLLGSELHISSTPNRGTTLKFNLDSSKYKRLNLDN